METSGFYAFQKPVLIIWTSAALLSVFAWNNFLFRWTSFSRAACYGLLIATSLFIAWFWWYNAYLGSGKNPAFAGSQLLPTIIKVAFQTSIPVVILLVLMGITRQLGEKALPHLLGIEIGPHWSQLNPQVMLPFFVIVFSFLAFIGFLVCAGLSFMAYGMTAPLSLAAVAGTLVIGGTWGRYFLLAGKFSDDLRTHADARRLGTSPDKGESMSRYRRLIEYRLGTREWNALVFHRMADEPHGLSYRFPGFLIGVEQANRYLIGVPGGDNASDVAKKDSVENDIRGLLNDRRRTFVSHIFEFGLENPDSPESKAGSPKAIETTSHYNLYESTDYGKAFEHGFDRLDSLHRILKDLLSKKNGKPDREPSVTDAERRKRGGYTHIMVYCMGWNTDQQESIRNYNSLMGFLSDAADEDLESKYAADTGSGKIRQPFRPLVIGISWPSEWSYLKPLSYMGKAGDADETGLVWGSYLLKKILQPLKKEYRIPLVLVGHSFGARVLTRAVASNPDWVKREPGPADPTVADSPKEADPPSQKELDLFVGLQGAFSANRFVHTGALTSGWMEGSPYLKLKEEDTRFIFTWSEHDKANPMAAYVTGAHHMGGKIGNEFCLQHKETFWPCIYKRKSEFKEKLAWQYPVSGHYFDPETGWDPLAKAEKNKIFTLDLSEIVKDQPYGKGGGAHSDIYTPEIGRFLWKSILAFAAGDFHE